MGHQLSARAALVGPATSARAEIVSDRERVLISAFFILPPVMVSEADIPEADPETPKDY
jgi:hypothetical protein